MHFREWDSQFSRKRNSFQVLVVHLCREVCIHSVWKSGTCRSGFPDISAGQIFFYFPLKPETEFILFLASLAPGSIRIDFFFRFFFFLLFALRPYARVFQKKKKACFAVGKQSCDKGQGKAFHGSSIVHLCFWTANWSVTQINWMHILFGRTSHLGCAQTVVPRVWEKKNSAKGFLMDSGWQGQVIGAGTKDNLNEILLEEQERIKSTLLVVHSFCKVW